MEARLMLKTSVLMISLGVLLSGCATRSRAPQAPPETRTVATSQAVHTVALTAEHIALIRAYYGDGVQGGGKRKKGLPPGIAKNLQRGKPLPPGIAGQHLPRDLYVRLPRPPAGLDYVIVAGKLLLVEAATQMVREILLDAVFS
jgi:hypothetical protein